MAKSEPTVEPVLTGHWSIVSMSEWEDDYLDEEGPAFFEFEENGSGEFRFGSVHGYMDGRLGTRDGEPAVEWSWDGNDETEAAQGRGWAVLKGNELHGMIFFHEGSDSEFVAKRADSAKPTRKRK